MKKIFTARKDKGIEKSSDMVYTDVCETINKAKREDVLSMSNCNMTIQNLQDIKYDKVRRTDSYTPAGQGLAKNVNIASTQSPSGFAGRRKEKYVLQDKIQDILHKYSAPSSFRQVKGCSKTSLSEVSIVMSKNGHASYKGLLHCHNVWLCPICSEKIRRERAEEIAKAIEWAYAQGYSVAMLTQTHPHHKGQGLSFLMDSHNKALRYFKSGRAWQNVKDSVGIIGTITSREHTYGENGWHFHTHSLLIVKHGEKLEALKDSLSRRWMESCFKAGLSCDESMLEYGLDITLNVHSSSYLVKLNKSWGADAELTMSAKKVGGKHPFDLALSGSQTDEFLFMEYARATYRRQQLVWSRGLKDLVGIREKADSDIVIEEGEEEELLSSDVIMTLSSREWLWIKLKKARSFILELAESKGSQGVREWFFSNGCIEYVFDLRELYSRLGA